MRQVAASLRGRPHWCSSEPPLSRRSPKDSEGSFSAPLVRAGTDPQSALLRVHPRLEVPCVARFEGDAFIRGLTSLASHDSKATHSSAAAKRSGRPDNEAEPARGRSAEQLVARSA